MPNVSFRAKVETVYNVDETIAYRGFKVPTLKRSHCDMRAFRTSKRFGNYANSALFPNLLARALREAGIPAFIRLDQIPTCVVVDESGFLAAITISFPEAQA